MTGASISATSVARLRTPNTATWLFVLLGAVYAPVIAEAAPMWIEDPYSAHGIVVPLLSGAVVWWKRRELAQAEARPSAWGFPLLATGLAVHWVAWVGHVRSIAMLSLPVALLGLVLVTLGNQAARIVRFPILYLAFCAPIPYFLVLPVSFPIQTLSARYAAAIVRAVGVPVTEEGFRMGLPNVTVEVAEQCSGFKKTVSLTAFAMFYASLFAVPFWRQALLTAAAIPVALGANILRVTGLLLGGAWGGLGAVAVMHASSDVLVYGLCFAALSTLGRALGCRRVRYTL